MRIVISIFLTYENIKSPFDQSLNSSRIDIFRNRRIFINNLFYKRNSKRLVMNNRFCLQNANAKCKKKNHTLIDINQYVNGVAVVLVKS